MITVNHWISLGSTGPLRMQISLQKTLSNLFWCFAECEWATYHQENRQWVANDGLLQNIWENDSEQMILRWSLRVSLHFT